MTKAIARRVGCLPQCFLQILGEEAFCSCQTFAHPVELWCELVKFIRRLPRSTVKLIHALLKLGLDAVGKPGNDSRESLVKQNMLG